MDLSPAQSGTDDKILSERIHPVVDQVVIRVPRAPRNGLAQSLQYRRLQLYIALLVMDALALVGAFALAGFVYDDGRGLYVAMMPAYLLLPLFQTIALYNAAYSQGSLEDWKRSLGRGVMALLISALLLNFFAFMTKSNEQFSRAIFALGFVGTIAGMAICRMMLDRFIRHMWGPNVLNSLLIEAGGPVVRIPHIYRVDAVEHALEPDLEDPVMLDRPARYIRNMDRVIVSCRPQDRVAWADILKCSGIHGEVISEYARQIGALGVVHHADAGVAPRFTASAAVRQIVLSAMPSSVQHFLRRVRRRPLFPLQGEVDFGDFARIRPLSTDFGFLRGMPVDRHYIEQFLAANRASITGNALEAGGRDYLDQFGHGLGHVDVVNAEGGPQATIVGDLGTPGLLQETRYDCIVLTQVLQYIYDLPAAAAQLHAALKPGGTLLITVPAISPMEQKPWDWYWTFNVKAMQRLFGEAFGAANVEVAAHGNAFAATCFIQGIAVEDVGSEWLTPLDETFPVLLTMKATKARD
jgi:SAM-dependent methyltransferase